MTMRVRIWRGSHEIGGNCVEVEARGARILLDLGQPLDVENALPPPVHGLAGGDSSLLGVLISHPHQDHYGLATKVGAPIYMGEAAARILRQAAFFGLGGMDVSPTGYLRDRETLTLGPFRITPFLMDHSAYDSYSLLVEAGGRRLFYTGDFRATGAKAALFHRLLRDPPKPVDVLLMEGTLMQASPTRTNDFPTEAAVADGLTDNIRETTGPALVAYSGQNIDRLVSVYKAARRSRRQLVVDLYTWAMARATGRSSIPQVGFADFRVFVPQHHRVLIKERGAFDLVKDIKGCRISAEEIAARANELVITYRSATRRILGRHPPALKGAVMVWSQWRGYLVSAAPSPSTDWACVEAVCGAWQTQGHG